ncbi:MAG: YqcC family protein [Candidatus Schmidhempelia sp.]|nr:YqcC family protein [Candidatus Schmidhempelia sp.]
MTNDKRSHLHEILNQIELELKNIQLWEDNIPAAESLASQQPFAIDTLTPTQWLQWIFLPKMRYLLEIGADLPNNIAIHPYFEQTLAQADCAQLLKWLKEIDKTCRA